MPNSLQLLRTPGSGRSTGDINLPLGLDIIEKLALEKKAILSTGQYDQVEIINRCLQLGCYLLPKNLMYYVSVSVYG